MDAQGVAHRIGGGGGHGLHGAFADSHGRHGGPLLDDAALDLVPDPVLINGQSAVRGGEHAAHADLVEQVTTARQPLASTTSTSSRLNPVEQPVMNQKWGGR